IFRERPWRRRCRAGKNLDIFALPPFRILVVLRRVYGRNQLREQGDRYRDALPRRDATFWIDIEPERLIPSIVQSAGFAVWNLADRLDPDILRARAGFKLRENILV